MITMFLLNLVCYHNMVLCNTVLIIWYSIAILYGNIVILYGTILTILSACGGFLSSRKSVAPRSVTPFFQNAPFRPPQPPKNATAAQPLSACYLSTILSIVPPPKKISNFRPTTYNTVTRPTTQPPTYRTQTLTIGAAARNPNFRGSRCTLPCRVIEAKKSAPEQKRQKSAPGGKKKCSRST
jgi:hypothetical protein